jgi:hypothetical protein
MKEFVVGQRVRFRDDEAYPSLGTVKVVSQGEYVIVAWDPGVYGIDARFSPLDAKHRLAIVDGDAAFPRHTGASGMSEGRCVWCNRQITDKTWTLGCERGMGVL